MWFVFTLPAMFIMLWAQSRVKSAYAKYSRLRNMSNVTGAQAARVILDSYGLSNVAVELTPGELSDHYDPTKKVLRLSKGVAQVPSVAALGIAAHEAGHAIQDHVGYAPMRVRAGLVPLVNIGSSMGWVFIALGFAAQASGLVWAGVFLFSTAVVFALVTLPVEFDASSRALGALQSSGLVSTVEFDGAKAVLDAAALTYVAGMLQAVAQLLYFVYLAMGMSRRN
jgi:uncharacterized protein